MFYNQPFFQLLLASLLFGFGGLFVVFVDLSVTVITFYRFLFAAIVLAVVIKWRHESFRLPKRQIIFAGLSGFFLAMAIVSWSTSIRQIGMGIATLLDGLQVFFLVGFGLLFYKEKLGWQRLLSLTLVVVGVSLLCYREIQLGDAGWSGTFFGLLAAFFYACSLLCLRQCPVGGGSSVYTTVFYTAAISTIPLGLFAWFTGYDFLIKDLSQFSALVLYAAIIHVGSWFLIAISIRHLSLGIVGLLMCAQPVTAMLVDFFWLGKVIHWEQWLGAVITLVAIYLGSQPEKN